MSELIQDLKRKIIENNMLMEDNNFSQFACKSYSGIRMNPQDEKIPDNQNIRPIFFHDTDKIIHSLAYTRYIDKTQVFFLVDNDHITHRVLHVQFVSKIARVIGRCLRLNEDLIEAIALGHDIGHTPYGHDGERYLNDICKQRNIGYFAHNAQSIKAIMELENGGQGLNLTLQVLDGILCHNGEFINEIYEPDWNKTKEQFLQEYRNCWSIENYRKIRPMTLEGCVVRICDIIAYIGRDIEDAIKVKLLYRNDIPKEIVNLLGDTNDKIINTLVTDIINNSFDKGFIKFSRPIFEALRELKDFNAKNIYSNTKCKTQDDKIKRMFNVLFEKYLNDIQNDNRESSILGHLNQMNEKYLNNNSNERIVIDYIAGMTDKYFNNEFKNIIIPQSYGFHFVE